ncbi:hypothetical protein VKT23_017415 [Stygiomarasmius scandens]|uniref:Uncharacterized protein n=1 Tax=Marasmiellus scandens TaxID=2682957 RepID=A0ABR1IUQ3_9AGAR
MMVGVYRDHGAGSEQSEAMEDFGTRHALFSSTSLEPAQSRNFSNTLPSLQPQAQTNHAHSYSSYFNINGDSSTKSSSSSENILTSRYDLRKRKAPVPTSTQFLSENQDARNPKKSRVHSQGRMTRSRETSIGSIKDLGPDVEIYRKRKIQPKSEVLKMTKEKKLNENDQAIRKGRGKVATLTILREKMINGVYLEDELTSPRISNQQKLVCNAPEVASEPTHSPSPISSLLLTQDNFPSSPDNCAFTSLRRSDAPTPSPNRVKPFTVFGSKSAQSPLIPMSELYEDEDITDKPVNAEQISLPYASSSPTQRGNPANDWPTPLPSSSSVSFQSSSSLSFQIFPSPWSAPPSTPCPSGTDASDGDDSGIEDFLTPGILDGLGSDSETEISMQSPSGRSQHAQHDAQKYTDDSASIFGSCLTPTSVESSTVGLGFSLPSPNLETIPPNRARTICNRKRIRRSLAASPSPLSVNTRVDEIAASPTTATDNGDRTLRATSDEPTMVSIPMYVSVDDSVGTERVGHSMFMQMQQALSLSEQMLALTARSEPIATEARNEDISEAPSIIVHAVDEKTENVLKDSRIFNGSYKSNTMHNSEYHLFASSLSSTSNSSVSSFASATTPVVDPVILPSEGMSPLFLTFPFTSIPSSGQLQDGVTPAYRPVSQSESDPSRSGQENRLHPFPAYFLDFLRARLEDPFLTPTDELNRDAFGFAVCASGSDSYVSAGVAGHAESRTKWTMPFPQSTSMSSEASNQNGVSSVQSVSTLVSLPLVDPTSEIDDSSLNRGHDDDGRNSDLEKDLTTLDDGILSNDSHMSSTQCLVDPLDWSLPSDDYFSDELLLQEGNVDESAGDDSYPVAGFLTPSAKSANNPGDCVYFFPNSAEAVGEPQPDSGESGQDVDVSFKTALETCDDSKVLADVNHAFEEMMKEIDGISEDVAALLNAWPGVEGNSTSVQL